MKREILFRGFNNKHKEWRYGYYFVNRGQHFIVEDKIEKNPILSEEDFAVNPETIGQYTGLKDKNGDKIFEGDIIKTPRGFIGEVVFGRAEEECTHKLFRRMVTDVFTTYGWVFKRADGFTIAIDDEILQGELIGNITDTPELMK